MRRLIFLLLIISLSFSASFTFTISQTKCPKNTDLLTTLSNLPDCIAESFFNMLVSGLIYSSEQFLNYSLSFLTATPQLGWFCSPFKTVMAILESFYTIMIMALGLYYIVSATDPLGRSKAKAWAKNLLFMIVFLSFSFHIFDAILSLNQYISSTVYAQVNSNLFNINASLSSIIFALVLLFSFTMTGWLTFTTLMARYILIPFLLMLFPIGIFLYFIPSLRAWGAFIFRFVVLVVFMTSADALVMLGISTLFNTADPNLSAPFIKAVALMVGFSLLGFVNSIIFLIAVLSAITVLFDSFSSLISFATRMSFIMAVL